jgi:ABC-2 type transport system permease protein
MTRPLSAFVQVLTADFQLRRLGRAAQGALVLVIALSVVDIAWSPVKMFVMLAGIASGIVIFACIFVVGAAISFWTLQDSEVLNVFTYGGSEMVSYPMTVYGTWLRRFFTFVIPLAFVTYLPALVVLDRSDPLGLPRALHYASPLVALLFVLVARGLWSLGVRHYQSTGS